jgi:hypothetical protein
MIDELKNKFQEQARIERYCVTVEHFECKMTEGVSVNAIVQKLMGSYGATWEARLYNGLKLSTDLILYSLSLSFSMFIMNNNMEGVIKPLNELYILCYLRLRHPSGGRLMC